MKTKPIATKIPMEQPLEFINVKALADAIASSMSVRNPTTRRLMNTEEAAEYCGLTIASFKKKVIRDQVRKVRLDRCWRFDITDLDAWIDNHKEQISEETAA